MFDVSDVRHTLGGVLVSVELPDARHVSPDALLLLPDEERALAAGFAPPRLSTFVGGRIALRRALSELGIDCRAVLRDARGAPLLPAGAHGSVSHKDHLAVAFAMVGSKTVGIDYEQRASAGDVDIGRHVLTQAERDSLASLEGVPHVDAVRLRFALKEAVYKALDPHVQRYVGFHEAEVWPDDEGRARIDLYLAQGEGPFVVTAQWCSFRDGFLAFVHIDTPSSV